jgi:hypothetical protein
MKTITLFILVVALWGCGKSSKKQAGNTQAKTSSETGLVSIPFAEIVNHPQEISLSSIASKVNYIPLETSTRSLVGEIIEICLTKDYIFIQHRRSPLLMQFDRNGKFIRNIGKTGKGPGEYTLIRCFSIDEKNRIVFIQENWRKEILQYSFDGMYLGSLRYNDEFVKIAFAGKEEFVCFKEPVRGSEKYVFNILKADEVLPLVKNYCFWDFQAPFEYGRFYSGRKTFYKYNDQLHLKGWYNDTIYKYNAGKVKPTIHIDLKEHKLPDDLRPERVGARIISSQYHWTSVSESNRFVFIYYSSYDPPQGQKALINGLVYYDKKSNQGYALQPSSDYTGFENDLDNGPAFKPFFTNDSISLCFIEAPDFMEAISSAKHSVSSDRAAENQAENKFPHVRENDNPILMVVKLKE